MRPLATYLFAWIGDRVRIGASKPTAVVLLCLAVNAIDALRSGELIVTASADTSDDSGGVTVQFALPIGSIAHKDVWIAMFDAASGNETLFKDSWMLHAIGQIVRADGGVLESGCESIAGRDCRVVRIRYEAGAPVSVGATLD